MITIKPVGILIDGINLALYDNILPDLPIENQKVYTNLDDLFFDILDSSDNGDNVFVVDGVFNKSILYTENFTNNLRKLNKKILIITKQSKLSNFEDILYLFPVIIKIKQEEIIFILKHPNLKQFNVIQSLDCLISKKLSDISKGKIV